MGEDLNDGVALTPSHFLSPVPKIRTPSLGKNEENNDCNYRQQKISSKETLLSTCRKRQKLFKFGKYGETIIY